MIVSILNKDSGFFSMLFFTINHYIYSKEKNINFKINSKKWLFKYKKGWTDYFKKINLVFNKNDNKPNYYKHGKCIGNYSINQYKNTISKIYLYNKKTITKINKKKKKLNLKINNYDSIFIRRGDKMISESIYINAAEYLKLLLLKNPNVQKIFLQTDDYNCYLELNEYIVNNNLNIKLITLCKDYLKGGLIIFDKYKNRIINNNVKTENTDYIKLNNNLKIIKPVNKMNNKEIYKHTMDMIIGIDIVLNSNICITDYQSNVGRFIKLSHNNNNNVFNLMEINQDIDYDKKICPSYSF